MRHAQFCLNQFLKEIFFQGGSWTVGRHVVHAEETIAEGGFGVVFLVKGKEFYFLISLYKNVITLTFYLF